MTASFKGFLPVTLI